MAPLDLTQLKTMLAVAEAGSLTAAAPLVFLSPSAVSEQMRKLEDAVGQPLLLRSKAGVVPTPAGARLLARARELLALSDEALRDLRGEALQGALHLAVTDYFRPGELAQLLGRLGRAYPRLQLKISVLKSGEIEKAYAQGDFDMGLSMRILTSAGVGHPAPPRAAIQRRERLVWMTATAPGAPPDTRPARGQPLRLLVLPDTCSLHRYTVKLLDERRVPYSIALVASGVAGLQSALAAGLGVACLNESAAGQGVAALAAPHGLPALPRVAFFWLPPRPGESPLVVRARELLAQQLG